MVTNEMVGIIVAAAVVVGSFAAMVIRAFKPMYDLNASIIELTVAIKNLTNNEEIQDARISKHGTEIDELKLKAENHEARIHSLERK